MSGSSDINSNEENSVENYDIESDPSEEVEMPIEDNEPEPELDPEPDPELEPEPESEEVVPIYNPLEVIVIELDTEDESIEGNTEKSTGDVGATFEGWDVLNGLQIGFFLYMSDFIP